MCTYKDLHTCVCAYTILWGGVCVRIAMLFRTDDRDVCIVEVGFCFICAALCLPLHLRANSSCRNSVTSLKYLKLLNTPIKKCLCNYRPLKVFLYRIFAFELKFYMETFKFHRHKNIKIITKFAGNQ